jgi:hypothetical protein
MREIKFRAWDGNKMWPECEISIDGEVTVFDRDKPVLIGLMTKPVGKWPIIHVMQYTGLKDINGKDIYEGDVLDSLYKWQVIFINQAFYARSKISAGYDGLLAAINHERKVAGVPIEIIGNIYEHPHLLEEV